jgi:nucleotide-binding universal stress UspA family protein
MTKPWTILAPVAMRQTSGSAIEHAIQVANGMNSRLFLLHVVSPRNSLRDDAELQSWPQAALADEAVRCGLRRVVLRGEPAATIGHYAEFVGADLILTEPAARSVWSRVRARSIASRLLTLTPRPVQLWNTRAAHDAAPFRCRQLLCVLELDGRDEPLIEAAKELSARTGANLEVMHVVPPISEALLLTSVGEPDRPLSSAVAAKRLRNLRDLLPSVMTTSILVGERQKSIAQAARRKSADLVLVGRREASGWPGASWELNAISSQAGCPVFSVSLHAPGPPGPISCPARVRPGEAGDHKTPTPHPYPAPTNSRAAANSRCAVNGFFTNPSTFFP